MWGVGEDYLKKKQKQYNRIINKSAASSWKTILQENSLFARFMFSGVIEWWMY